MKYFSALDTGDSQNALTLHHTRFFPDFNILYLILYSYNILLYYFMFIFAYNNLSSEVSFHYKILTHLYFLA